MIENEVVDKEHNIIFYDKVYNEVLQANSICINVLENSKVQGRNVYVKKCRNSTIEADHIFVEQLLPNNKIIPFQNVVISESISDNNLFNVDFYSNLNQNEDYGENLKSVLDFLNKVNMASKISYNYLINNQVRIFEIKNKNVKTNTEKQFLESYINVLKKYNSEIQTYKKLIKLKFSLELRIKIVKDYPYNTMIWIDTKSIRKNNMIEFVTSPKQKIKSFIVDRGLFHLSRNNVVIKKEFVHIEENVKNIMQMFKSFENFQKNSE